MGELISQSVNDGYAGYDVTLFSADVIKPINQVQ